MAGAVEKPTRSYAKSTAFERFVGFLVASVFSVIYLAAPVTIMGTVLFVFLYPWWLGTWLLVGAILTSLAIPSSVVEQVGAKCLTSWAMQQMPKYFNYEEYHEVSDRELQKAGKNFIISAHPHGVVSFCGMCGAVATAGAADGYGPTLAKEVPTAAASVIKLLPFLKDVLGIYGVIDASSNNLTKRLSKPLGSFVLYVGGMIELFYSSPGGETVFLNGRKGFIKLALRTGADVVPIYLFGNTTVLTALTWGPLATLSRKLGVSVTLMFGLFGLPLPRAVQLTYARGRPLGLPHIENPSPEDIDKWHAIYCEKLKELFDRYKVKNPDYKNKELKIK